MRGFAALYVRALSEFLLCFFCGVYCPGFGPPAGLDLLHVKRRGGKLEVPLGRGGTVLSGPAVRFWHRERGFQMHGDLSGEGEECCECACFRMLFFYV